MQEPETIINHMTLGHYWTVSDKLEIQSNLYAITGKTGNTNLNWYDAKDQDLIIINTYQVVYSMIKAPYQSQIITNENEFNVLTSLWQTQDPNTTQLNWDGMYNANYKNLYAQNNVGGDPNNSAAGNRSKYIIEEYRLDPRHLI